MTRPSSTWKSIERQLAALFGAKRYGPQGEDVPDFAFKLTPQVRIRFEVKHGKHIPKKLQQAVQQVKESRLPRTEVEVATELRGVMMHPHGAPLEDTLVVLPLSDWLWVTTALKKEE